MRKSYFLFFGLLVSTIVVAQQTVVNKNGKLITVNTPSDGATLGLIKLTNELGGSANAPEITNAAVIGKVLTGFTATAGTVGASDNIVTAIGKLDGNVALKATLAQDLGNTADLPKVIGIQGIPVIATAPTANQILQFNAANSRWEHASLSSVVSNIVDTFSPTTAGQTSFTLSKTPLGAVSFFINGVRIADGAISVSGTTATYNSANNSNNTLTVDDSVVIIYVVAL